MKAGKFVASGLLLATLIVSGCSSDPIARDLRSQATQTPFGQVKADPEGTRGTIVIWGGRIIDVANTTNGGSIYILCLPVRSNGRPVANGASPGRFIAASPEFLDPEMFPVGAQITVAGPLDGVWTEPLEDIEYTYPVVQIDEVHLWPEERQAQPSASFRPRTQVYWGPGWWWYGGMPVYYPGFRPGFRGSFHASVRVGPSRRMAPPPRRGRWH